MRVILYFCIFCVLVGCTTVHVERDSTTAAEIDIPGTYDHAFIFEEGIDLNEQWWGAFGSEDLKLLIAEAQNANQTLAQGSANIDASRAVLKVTSSAFQPQISGDLSSTTDLARGVGDANVTGRLSASYELDLFGLNEANRTSAVANVEATIFAQRALELMIQSDVASNYFSILAVREQLKVASQNLEISERIFELVEVRYKAGAISGYDVSSQRSQLAAARARIPQLRAQQKSLETALAILLGKVPQGYSAPKEDILSVALPVTKAGIPSDLLLRRPDLLQSEANLRAANANVYAARAAFFPSINLGVGVSGLLTGGASITESVSLGIVQSIFSGGRLEGQFEGAMAQRDGLLATYNQSILDALGDVDVNLHAIHTSKEREDQILVSRDAAFEALSASELQYRAGMIDLTSLLSAQQAYFDASDSFVQARLDRILASLSLYVALGGSY